MHDRTLGNPEAYIGISPDCGCVVAIMVNTVEHKRDVAKELGKWVRDGLRVEPETIEGARSRFDPCTHRKHRTSAAQETLSL